MIEEDLSNKYEKIKAACGKIFTKDVLPADFTAFMNLISGQAKVNIICNRVMCSLSDDIINVSEVTAPTGGVPPGDVGYNIHGVMYSVAFCMEFIQNNYEKASGDSAIDRLRDCNHIFTYQQYSVLLGLRTLVAAIYANIDASFSTINNDEVTKAAKFIVDSYDKLLASDTDLAREVNGKIIHPSFDIDNQEELIGEATELASKYGSDGMLYYLAAVAKLYLAGSKTGSFFDNFEAPTTLSKKSDCVEHKDDKFSFTDFT